MICGVCERSQGKIYPHTADRNLSNAQVIVQSILQEGIVRERIINLHRYYNYNSWHRHQTCRTLQFLVFCKSVRDLGYKPRRPDTTWDTQTQNASNTQQPYLNLQEGAETAVSSQNITACPRPPSNHCTPHVSVRNSQKILVSRFSRSSFCIEHGSQVPTLGYSNLHVKAEVSFRLTWPVSLREEITHSTQKSVALVD